MYKIISDTVKTLPIGLYAKRRILTEVDKKAETSYYSPIEDKIVISSSLIEQGMKNFTPTPNYNEESAIRSMTYHEVSHAILTPNYFDNWYFRHDSAVYNIVEDERIETLLKDFYYNVDFKKHLSHISPFQKEDNFFNLVRYRYCSDKTFVVRLNQLLVKHSKLNTGHDTYSSEVSDYLLDINHLYDDYCHKFPKGKLPKQSSTPKCSSQKNNSTELTEEEMKALLKEISEQQNESLEQIMENESKEEIGEGMGLSPIIEKAFTVYEDNKLTETLNTIISNFNKKNNSGNGMLGYSGILNPRNVGRKDFRYFDKKCSVNGNNKFGTFNLNLFIDCSGSFAPHEKRVNTLIKSLKEIEKRNKNFTVTFYFCGNGISIPNQKNPLLICDSGNRMYIEQTKEMVKKAQKGNTYNYNIVLFDGRCYPDKKNGKNALEYFDRADCYLILEQGNKDYVTNFKSATIEFENYNYTERLTDIVIKALQRAFK